MRSGVAACVAVKAAVGDWWMTQLVKVAVAGTVTITVVTVVYDTASNRYSYINHVNSHYSYRQTDRQTTAAAW